MHTLLKLGSLAAAASLMLAVGCGGDDDDPPSTNGGSGGSGGSSSGGTGGSSSGGTGGSSSGGSGGSSSGGSSSGGTGGMGAGGSAGGMGDPLTAADCFSDDGMPGAKVTGSELGAFADESDWHMGWSNFKLDETPEDTSSDTPEPFPTTGDRELEADKVYLLEGVVYVADGETLKIPAGTIIRGASDPFGVLVVSRGGRIEADGTADKPIIFTSNAPNGSKEPGQWGGVVVLGKAAGFKGDNVLIEGLPDEAENQYGGSEDDDDSGFLRYVRIEFGGIEIGDGNEINGLTLGGVGSGTEISHVAVNSNLDDCFEWFGGTVDADHLVCVNAGDDMFDADQGYRGTLSYLLGTHVNPLSSDPNGFEMDSDLAGGTPTTDLTVEHATLCGTGAEELNLTYGMVLRENLEGELSDIVVTGFNAAVDTRDDFGSESDPHVSIEDSLFTDGVTHDVAYDETETCDDKPTCDDDDGFDERDWFADGSGNSDGS